MPDETTTPEATDNPVTRVKIYRDRDGEWRWTAFAGNNEKVADSAEGYTGYAHTREIATRMFPDAELDIGDAITKPGDAPAPAPSPAQAVPTGPPLAAKIVSAVLENLKGRKGIGDELDQIDADTYAGLEADLITDVENELGAATMAELLVDPREPEDDDHLTDPISGVDETREAAIEDAEPGAQ